MPNILNKFRCVAPRVDSVRHVEEEICFHWFCHHLINSFDV